jgi:hypothetical protein
MSQKSHTPVTPQDYFDLMQKMANPGGQSFQSLFFPQLDVKDIEKKIIELKSVEHWLQANLGMLQLSIQTLEYQKALLTPPKDDARKPEADAANPAMWAWQMMNQASEQFQAAARQAMTPAAPTPTTPPSKPKARASSRKSQG